MTGVHRRQRSPWWRWGDAGLLVLALCPPLLMQSSMDDSARAWWLLGGFEVVAASTLLVRRKWPIAAFLALTAAVVAMLFEATAGHTAYSVFLYLPLAVATQNMWIHCASLTRVWLAVLIGCTLVVLGVWANFTINLPMYHPTASNILGALAPMPLYWAAGFAARLHRVDLVATKQRVDDVLREQRAREHQAAQQERVRIAREMHDVVAHSLTLLVVRAETMRARGGDLPAWARIQIDGLASAGRQAGTELRDLLRVLRAPDDALPLRPMPGLGDLPALIERSRATGARVGTRIEVEVDVLPRPVQLVVYRIVQESLTNARRYSPGAPIIVTIVEKAGQLHCEVVNARPTEPRTPGWGTGLGLISMRERVDALGGELRAGPTSEGGFRMAATLPLSTISLDTAGV